MHSIRTKLASSLGIAALLLLAALGTAVYSLISVTNRSAAVLDEDLPRMQLFNEMYQEGLLGGQAIRNYILHPGPIPRQVIPASESAFDAALKGAYARSDDKAELARIGSDWDTVRDARRKAEALADANDQQGALAVIQSEETPRWRDLRLTIMDLVKSESARIRSDAHADLEQARLRIWIAIGMAVLALILGGALVTITAVRFTDRLARLTDHVERATQNHDLTLRLEPDSADEAGRISSSFNRFMESLQKTVKSIRERAAAVSTSAGQIASTSEKIADASHAQSDATARMAASVEQMTASISSVASTAQKVSSNASQSLSQAEAGNEAVKSLISEMSRIESVVEDLASQVGAFVSSTKAINRLTGQVKEIADQTNLLALNAAIEAARAGEHGRGFAVVADEVRELAERTRQSTTEVSIMLAEIQKETKSTVDSMDASLGLVAQGARLVSSVTDSIQQNNQNISTMVNEINEMTHALEEQKVAVQNVALNVAVVANTAEQTSSNAKMTSLNADKVHEEVLELQSGLDWFRLDQ